MPEMTNRIMVNPRRRDGQVLKVLNEKGFPIPETPHGTSVKKTTYISRQIKSGDLVIVQPPVKKEKPKSKNKQEKAR
jgi:hypothetical protein